MKKFYPSLSFLKKEVSTIWITLALAAYFTIGLNFVLASKIYKIISEAETVSLLFIISIPITFVAAFTIILTPFVSKYIFKPICAFLVLIAATVNYATVHFGVIFNQDMITNILETSPAEAQSYLNAHLIVWFLLSAGIPVLFIFLVRVKYDSFVKELLKKLGLLLGAGLVIGLIGAAYYKDYASFSTDNPKLIKDINPVYALVSTARYINHHYVTSPLPYKVIAGDAKRSVEEEKYLVVFLVGETARAQNYPANGYQRNTTSYTDNIDNVISFYQASSCGTATAVSLPCMFSLLGRQNFSQPKADAQDNVIDILKRAHIQSIWLDNNTGCKGVCDNILSTSLEQMSEVKCTTSPCYDEAFFQVLDKKIESLNGQEGIVYLHIMGSHGPSYYKRYPPSFEKFKPACQTSDLQKCTGEEIVNAYDNTILYTDYIISEVIRSLKKYEKNYATSVIYVSDHGESLGEDGIYLHGMPYAIAPDTQNHVPFMMWFSDKMIEHKKMNIKCLKEKARTGGFSHDNISHTILNFFDVKTRDYISQLDLIRLCEDE